MALWKIRLLYNNKWKTELEKIEDEIRSLENIIDIFHQNRRDPYYSTMNNNKGIDSDEEKLARLKKQKQLLLSWKRNNLKLVSNNSNPVEKTTSTFKNLTQSIIW